MDVTDETSELILPPGVEEGVLDGEDGPLEWDRAVIDNRTELPDGEVEEALRTYMDESSAFSLRRDLPIEVFDRGGGSMMARAEFRTPSDIPDEIRLARHLAERDDDVAAVMGEMIGLAFSDGIQVRHGDERTEAIFNAVNDVTDIEGSLANMYREWLIAGQVATTQLYTREELSYELSGSDRQLSANMAVPRIGVLPSENIRVIGSDMLGMATLAYDPDNERLRRWLREYFDETVTPARKAELGRIDRVAASMFIGRVTVNPFEDQMLSSTDGFLYLLNPKIVQRTTQPKGAWPHPRPTMTRNFPLLEAKRLLNVMDFALLQGGSNFIVVAKKGSDKRPAKGREIKNLREVVRRASKVGVLVGDHRLSFEIITPKLDELLNPSKRKLLGRKMAMAMLRLSEQATENAGGEGGEAEAEVKTRVIEWDRGRLTQHVQRNVYKETARRNPKFLKGTGRIWVMKIILQGSQYFNDFVLKLRDRGDISRRTAVEAGGFDYQGEKGERERELANGDDDVMIPGVVPHTSPEQPGQGSGPQDNGGGRPLGAKTGEEKGPRKEQVIQRNAGETIKAWFDEEAGQVLRMGEDTERLLEAYPDREAGRITGAEQKALSISSPERIGPTIFVPVNTEVAILSAKAMRLSPSLSALIGFTPGGTMITKAIGFREPEYTEEYAETMVMRWGFRTSGLDLSDPNES